MKILKSYKLFLEALKDEIPKHQIDALSSIHGKHINKYLDLDVPTKAENIKEGIWKLSSEEKDKALDLIFDFDSDEVLRVIKDIVSEYKKNKNFISIFNKSNINNISLDFDKKLKPLELFNRIEPFFQNNFLSLNIKETKGTEKVERDSNGSPIMENGKIKKVKKLAGDPVFNKNVVSFNKFMDSYDLIIPQSTYEIENITEDIDVREFYAHCKEYVDLHLFKNFDLELYISSKPEDILNMSISKFYDSCQNLHTGEMSNQVLPNIFDKNMKIAYLMFNTPFTANKGVIIPITSFCRCIIRNIRGKIYFDQVYPNNDYKLDNFFYKIITKYTGMKSNYKGGEYYYTTPIDNSLDSPYMDNLEPLPIVENDETKALAKYLNVPIHDIVSGAEDFYLDYLYFYKNKLFYVVKKDNDTFSSIINLLRFNHKKYSKKFQNSLLQYFDKNLYIRKYKLTKYQDPIILLDDTIYNGYSDLMDYIDNHPDEFDIKKMKQDGIDFYTLIYTVDGKSHIVDDCIIYQVDLV